MPKSPKNPTKTKTLNHESSNNATTPKKSSRKLNKNDSKQNISKNNLNSSQNSIKNDEISDCETTTKRNAFEMMMDNRSKIIGRNSPGKERESDDDDDDKIDKKSEKITRKLFLENWSDSKGASKRKRIEAEIEQCINEKMEKRSKRLKNMLKIDDTQSEDDVEIVNNNELENNTQLSDENVKAWRMKIKLCMEENQEKIINNSNTNGRFVNGRVLREKKLKPNFYNEDLIIENTKQQQQSVKIAPVFRRSLPKPKIDPIVLEAKREFLLSGIPTSFKKELTKHPSFDDYKYDVFPTVSHVQQKDEHSFWNLPRVDLKLLPEEDDATNFSVETSKFSLELHKTSINNNNNREGNINFDRIRCYKPIVEKIKLQNPNYPIYRMFKILYEQSGYRKIVENNEKIIKKRGRKKKKDINKKISVVEEEQDSKNYLLWTEKYKPKDSKQILGNHHTITSLKNWLSTFKNNKKSNNNNNNNNRSSESEFDTDDSRDSFNTIRNNTVILTGPNGCGKTSAIYAICNELDYNIIEINSSMKRTGKRLLHDLQEATQSHQVKRQQQQQQQNNLTNFLNKQQQQQQQQDKDNKICVLLIEDIDIIFEQEDESFYSALNQISSITKRPIILTTNNYNSLIEQKFLLQFQLFRFQSLTTITITNIWLQLLCLIEGIFIDLISIKQLLDKNYGDIRKTLLELQFWVNTGGQNINQQQQLEQQIINIDDNNYQNINDDDDSNLTTIISDDDQQLINYKTHYNCINCFETIINNELYELTNLEKIWWNLPNFLHLPNPKTIRLRTLLINNDDDDDDDNSGIIDDNDNKIEFIDKLEKFSTIYDNLSLIDFYYKSSTINSNLNQLWQINIKDSLSLNENLEDMADNRTIGYDLSHYLIFNNLKYYGFQIDKFDLAVPEPIEITWRNKMRSCDKNFRNAIPLMTEHLSIILDYMPILRNIARTELQRSIENTKRNNRFYNYLRNLGINCNDKTYKLACNIFKI